MLHDEYDDFFDAVRREDFDYLAQYLGNINIPQPVFQQALMIPLENMYPKMFVFLLANGAKFPEEIPLQNLKAMFPDCRTKEQIIFFLSEQIYGYSIQITPALDVHIQHIANLLAPRRYPVAPQTLFVGRQRTNSQPKETTGVEKADSYVNRPRAFSH